MRFRVIEMRVGIVAPKTAIASLKLNLSLSYKRMNSENVQILKMIENNEIIETGLKGGSSRNNKME